MVYIYYIGTTSSRSSYPWYGTTFAVVECGLSSGLPGLWFGEIIENNFYYFEYTSYLVVPTRRIGTTNKYIYWYTGIYIPVILVIPDTLVPCMVYLIDIPVYIPGIPGISIYIYIYHQILVPDNMQWLRPRRYATRRDATSVFHTQGLSQLFDVGTISITFLSVLFLTKQ